MDRADLSGASFSNVEFSKRQQELVQWEAEDPSVTQ